jgi:hypothetical protein
MKYCASPWNFTRRLTREVTVGDPARGGVVIGGHHPVVKQSMLTCDTMDTALHATEEAKQKIDYTDHEPKIETAIGTLKDLAKSL